MRYLCQQMWYCPLFKYSAGLLLPFNLSDVHRFHFLRVKQMASDVAYHAPKYV